MVVTDTKVRAKRLAQIFAAFVGKEAIPYTNEYRGEGRKVHSGWYVPMTHYSAEFRTDGECGLCVDDPDHSFEFCPLKDVAEYYKAMFFSQARLYMELQMEARRGH